VRCPVIRLQYERIRRNLTQGQLAYISKLSQPLISLIETGRQNPTEDELEQLARALAISPPSVLLLPVTIVLPEIEERTPEATT
jgi:transcriptional regulator with XRE-family HTH domain